MIDELKANREVTRGAQAKALLESDLLKEAFSDLEKAYIERWQKSHIDDEKGREKLFLAVNIVGKVREHLSTVIANGHFAAKQLDDLAKETERKKRFGIV